MSDIEGPGDADPRDADPRDTDAPGAREPEGTGPQEGPAREAASPEGPRPDDREPRAEVDIDSAFAAIVAEFSATSPRGANAPWPASEDLYDVDEIVFPEDEPTPPVGGRATDRVEDRTSDRAGDRGPGIPGERRGDRAIDRGADRPRLFGPGLDGPGVEPRGRWTDDDLHGPDPVPVGFGLPGSYDPADPEIVEIFDDEDRFVPPDPPPIGQGDLISRVAWVSVIGAPIFLLLCALVWRGLPTGLLVACLIAFVAGFVVLVARMPADVPDDPDDGAVV